MTKDIFVFVEYKDGSARKVSLELLTKGKEIAEKNGAVLYAGVIGFQAKDIAEVVKGFADKVVVVDNENLKDYRYDTYVSVIEQLVKKYQPSMVLGGSTVTGKDLFPRLAARLNVPIVSDAVGIGFDGGRLKIKKPLYGGKVISWISFKDGVSPMVTFRPNSFTVEKFSTNGEVIEEAIDATKDQKYTVLSMDKGAQKGRSAGAILLYAVVGDEGPEHFQVSKISPLPWGAGLALPGQWWIVNGANTMTRSVKAVKQSRQSCISAAVCQAPCITQWAWIPRR